MRIVAPSILSADFGNLERDIKMVDRSEAEWVHIDVMDGHFVPNMTFGPDFPNAMHKVTNLPLDIHLMCEEPEFICSKIDVHEGDIVSTHVELDKDLSDFAADIHSKGALFGVVINPDTPVEAVAPHMAYTDMVTLMLVHPGFSGAKLVDGILDKVALMRQWLDNNGYEKVLISVDGSVSCERAELMAGMGANVFVGGTAGVYRKGMTLDESIPQLRAAISK